MLFVSVASDSIPLTCYACENETSVNKDPFDTSVFITDECNHEALPHHEICEADEVSVVSKKCQRFIFWPLFDPSRSP